MQVGWKNFPSSQSLNGNGPKFVIELWEMVQMNSWLIIGLNSSLSLLNKLCSSKENKFRVWENLTILNALFY